jgi:hypothetical protein
VLSSDGLAASQAPRRVPRASAAEAWSISASTVRAIVQSLADLL